MSEIANLLAQSLAASDPGMAEFIAECDRLGTSEAVIEAAEKRGYKTPMMAVHPLDPSRQGGVKVQHPVESVDMLPDLVGQRVELLGAGDVELDHRGGPGEPLGDPCHQRRPGKRGQHQGGAFLLRDPGRVKGDRGVGQHTGDQDPLTVENAH